MAEVGRRARPVQARSQATLERILEAARHVLVERGVQGFNTNVVAERAGVNVGTLYHYFDDKNAVLQELYDRDEAKRASFLGSMLPEFVTTSDLDGWLRRLVNGLCALRDEQLGTVMLRRATRVIPELSAVHDRSAAAMVPTFAQVLRMRQPELTVKRAEAVARTVLEMGSSMLDLIGERPQHAAALRRELRVAMGVYLGSVFAAG